MMHRNDSRPFVALSLVLFLGLFFELLRAEGHRGSWLTFVPNVLIAAAFSAAVGAGSRWLVGLLLRPQRPEDVEDYDDGPRPGR
jgi:hypothetical protein